MAVTVLAGSPWRNGSVWTFPGSLAGIKGVLTKSAADAWTFARTTAGTATVVPAETKFVSAQQAGAGVGRIIWAGRNNPTLPRPAADVRAMAAEAQRVGAPYMIFPIFNTRAEVAGSAGYANVMATNAEYAKDPNFYDMRGYIIRNGLADAGLTATAADTAAIAEDCIPPSLSSDGTHMNAAGYAVIGKRAAAVSAARGWYAAAVVTPAPIPVVGPARPADALRRYIAASTTGGDGASVTTVANEGTATGAAVSQSGAPTKRVTPTRTYLEFDGVDDWMRPVESDAAIGTGAFTIYGVARFRGVPTTGNWPVVAGNFGGQAALSVSPTPALVAFRDTFLIADALVPGTTWHAFVAVFDGASTVIRMDNLAEKTGTTGTAAPARMEVGRNTNSSGFAQIDLAEWGSYSRALTAAERAELVTALTFAHKLGAA